MAEEITDWDDAYANGAHIEGAADYPPKWAAAAAAYRAGMTSAELDVPYGDHERQRLDLFWPDAAPKGLAVFVHGGYWLKFDKSWWSHLVEGARANGWAVAAPSYVLAPEARISDITAMIGAAVKVAAGKVAGPIHMAGHSAGGHLVSRMACKSGPLGADTAARVARVLSISGLHDLRPLMKTSMNAELRLDPAEAEDESAALTDPHSHITTIAWVGGAERPEFIRQTQVLEAAWKDRATITSVVDPQRHHFDVIEPLADPASPITTAWVG